jgi:integrase
MIENQELALVEGLQEMVDTAMVFTSSATSKNTKRTYVYGAKSFLAWCATQGVRPLEVQEKIALVVFYASEMARRGNLKASTISCYVVGVCSYFREHGYQISISDKPIATVLKGINVSLGTRPVKKEPILTKDIKQMVEAIRVEQGCQPRLIGVRDRALLLVGFAGAFRRSELVALTVEDVTYSRDGIKILVRRSKTDQEGAGLEKIIPYGACPLTCPVRALQDWIEGAGITGGAIFRRIDRHGNMGMKSLSSHAVALIVKRNGHIGGDSEKFSGHSLRSGFITSASENNVSEHLIMLHTGHKSLSEMRGYIRRGRSFIDTAAGMVGL